MMYLFIVKLIVTIFYVYPQTFTSRNILTYRQGSKFLKTCLHACGNPFVFFLFLVLHCNCFFISAKIFRLFTLHLSIFWTVLLLYLNIFTLLVFTDIAYQHTLAIYILRQLAHQYRLIVFLWITVIMLVSADNRKM